MVGLRRLSHSALTPKMVKLRVLNLEDPSCQEGWAVFVARLGRSCFESTQVGDEGLRHGCASEMAFSQLLDGLSAVNPLSKNASKNFADLSPWAGDRGEG